MCIILGMYCMFFSKVSLLIPDLLSSTVSCDPQALLESVSKVREAFDYLSYLPPATAEGLMKAVQPLLKLSMALKDSLVLVLKKAMFSK